MLTHRRDINDDDDDGWLVVQSLLSHCTITQLPKMFSEQFLCAGDICSHRSEASVDVLDSSG